MIYQVIQSSNTGKNNFHCVSIRKKNSIRTSCQTPFFFSCYREHGQGTSDELRQRDFRKELEEREAKSSGSSSSKSIPAGVRRAIEANTVPSKKPKLDHISTANLDQDDPIDQDDSSSSDDDSDDDTAALLEELNKIKRERAVEAEKKEQEKKQEEERIRMENVLSGNPLLNYSNGKAGPSDMKVKRRWDDDVVFKNCARTEPDKKGAFINDSLRSEFHRKFMEKYIK